MKRTEQEMWLLGFVSGYNWGSHDGEDVASDISAMTVWVDTYCSGHSLDSVVTAAARLIDELRSKRTLPPIIMRPN